MYQQDALPRARTPCDAFAMRDKPCLSNGLVVGAERALHALIASEGWRAKGVHIVLIVVLEILGVQRQTDSSLVQRGRIEAAPRPWWSARRECPRRLKLALNNAGIEIRFPQSTLHALRWVRREASQGTAGACVG